MTEEIFRQSIRAHSMLSQLTDLEKGYWYAATGEWDTAHSMAQAHEGEKEFDHLHAYLHRAEGDEWNARYWYNRVGVDFPKVTIQEELDQLIKQLF